MVHSSPTILMSTRDLVGSAIGAVRFVSSEIVRAEHKSSVALRSGVESSAERARRRFADRADHHGVGRTRAPARNGPDTSALRRVSRPETTLGRHDRESSRACVSSRGEDVPAFGEARDVARDERSPCFAHPAGIAGFWLWRARGLHCCPRDSLEGGVTGRLPGRKIPPDLFEVRSDGVEGIATEGHP